jgi:hypothetical protein
LTTLSCAQEQKKILKKNLGGKNTKKTLDLMTSFWRLFDWCQSLVLFEKLSGQVFDKVLGNLFDHFFI